MNSNWNIIRVKKWWFMKVLILWVLSIFLLVTALFTLDDGNKIRSRAEKTIVIDKPYKFVDLRSMIIDYNSDKDAANEYYWWKHIEVVGTISDIDYSTFENHVAYIKIHKTVWYFDDDFWYLACLPKSWKDTIEEFSKWDNVRLTWIVGGVFTNFDSEKGIELSECLIVLQLYW